MRNLLRITGCVTNRIRVRVQGVCRVDMEGTMRRIASRAMTRNPAMTSRVTTSRAMTSRTLRSIPIAVFHQPHIIPRAQNRARNPTKTNMPTVHHRIRVMTTPTTIATIANETANGVHANAKRFNTFIMCITKVIVPHRARLDTVSPIETLEKTFTQLLTNPSIPTQATRSAHSQYAESMAHRSTRHAIPTNSTVWFG